MRTPILRTGLVRYQSYKNRVRLNVQGGLHMIKGNKTPYFTCTVDIRSGRNSIGGGCDHETILRHFPEFTDLAALHLSDIDGVPSHGVANAWYWFAGAKGGLGERFHGGNADPKKTPDECAQILAGHLRISLDAAMLLRETISTKKQLETFCEEQRPRWKREADACIAKHDLQVFGDPWPQAA